MSRRYLSRFAFIGMLAFAVLFGVGCNKSSAPAPHTASQAVPQPAPQPRPSDDQVATEVQNRLQADPGLDKMAIQTQAVNGVVTLSGTVNGEAARELAANDAAQVNGVRTVVNNLIVQAAQTPATRPDVDAMKAAKKKADEEARIRRQQQARKLREQQEAQQQAAANSVPAPPPNNTGSQAPPPVQPPPPPPPQPIIQTVTIPAGSDLAVRITENLQTGQTQTNENFHGVLADSIVVNGVLALRRGADVRGIVLDAKDATHFKGQSELSLGLQQIRTREQVLAVSTDPLVRQGAARGKNTAVKAGGGALLGTLIGALAGGGRGAAVGAVAGAGVGAGANAVTRGQQVQIPSETVLHFILNQPMHVTVTIMPGGQSGSQDNGGRQQLQPPN